VPWRDFLRITRDMASHTGSIAGWSLAALLALASIGWAAADSSVSDSIEVALVNVDVWVRDAESSPVTDLEADDFRLLVDGEEWAIANFSLIDQPSSHADSGQALSLAGVEPTRVALYIDTAFMRPGQLQSVESVLEDFLLQDLPAGIPVMLAKANPDFQIVQGFTADRRAVLGHLGDLAASIGVSRIETEYSQIQREFERAFGRPTPGAMPAVPGAQADAVLTQLGSFAAHLESEVEAAAARLGFLVTALEGMDGRQEVLLVTGRPPANAGVALLTAWREETGQNPVFSQEAGTPEGGSLSRRRSDAGSEPPDVSGFGSRATSTTDHNAAGAFRQSGMNAAASGVTIHAIDLSPTTGSESLAAAGRASQGASGAPSLGIGRSSSLHHVPRDRRPLADMVGLTGGELISQDGALASDLGGIVARWNGHYSLAFRPPVDEDQGVHDIEIELPDDPPGHTLVHRRFFRTRTHDQLTAQATVSTMLLGEVSNPLEAKLETHLIEGEETESPRAQITLNLPFSRIALRPDGKYHLGQISLFTLSGRRQRQGSAVKKEVLPVRVLNEELLTALGRSIEYSWEVDLSAGAGDIAIGVRDDLSALVSTLLISVQETAQ